MADFIDYVTNEVSVCPVHPDTIVVVKTKTLGGKIYESRWMRAGDVRWAAIPEDAVDDVIAYKVIGQVQPDQ